MDHNLDLGQGYRFFDNFWLIIIQLEVLSRDLQPIN